jgi:hypothetical protein
MRLVLLSLSAVLLVALAAQYALAAPQTPGRAFPDPGTAARHGHHHHAHKHGHHHGHHKGGSN